MNLIAETADAHPGTATTQSLRVRSHPVRVVTESPAAQALLAETFYPAGMQGVSLDAATSEEPLVTIVDLVRSPAEIADLIAAAAATMTAAEYELTRDYRQPRYDDGERTVFVLDDEQSGEVGALIRTGRRAVLVRLEGRWGDRWLTRVVRELATRFASAQGSLILHASALVHRGHGYLVIGDSGAGKSTTSIALARLLPSAGWMGNDRMHADRVDGTYRLTACPLPLGVNKGTLDLIGATGFDSWDVRAGIPGPETDWDRFQGEDKLKLSCNEVARYLQVAVIPEAPIGGIILPRVNRAAGYHCEPADLDYAAEVIERNCFSVDEKLYGDDWLRVPVPEAERPPSIREFLEDVARLPLLRCSVGNADHLSLLANDLQAAVKLAG